MNSSTMSYGYKLHLVNFQRSLKRTSEQFPNIVKKVLGLISQLEIVVEVDNEIRIKHFRAASEGLIIDLEFPPSKIDIIKGRDWLTRAFPECTITGETLEITLNYD